MNRKLIFLLIWVIFVWKIFTKMTFLAKIARRVKVSDAPMDEEILGILKGCSADIFVADMKARISKYISNRRSITMTFMAMFPKCMKIFKFVQFCALRHVTFKGLESRMVQDVYFSDFWLWQCHFLQNLGIKSDLKSENFFLKCEFWIEDLIYISRIY